MSRRTASAPRLMAVTLLAAAVLGTVALAAAVAATVAAAVALVVLPAALVAVVAVTAAWLRAWPPRRLCAAGAWSLVLLAVWVADALVTRHSLAAVPATAWHDARAGRYLVAAVLAAPAAVPVGLLAGGWAWARRIALAASGTGRGSPLRAARFDQRLWRRQVRAARARAPKVPLLTADGDFAAGAVIRAAGHPARGTAVLPARRLAAHQVILGETGTGKTTLMLRQWAAFMQAGQAGHAAGRGPVPLLVVLDCKGGPDARRVAGQARQLMAGAGVDRFAVWPDQPLSLWTLPPDILVTTLADLIEHGTGGAAYYHDLLEAVVALAVGAPPGPPASSGDFLARLDTAWLAAAYAGPGLEDRHARVRAAARQIGDVATRYEALLRRTGHGLDGTTGFEAADAWYCILEGTGQVEVAEAQARALTDLLTSLVTAPGGAGRKVLLAVDEFSAVARRLPVWQLFERGRSLGIGVHVSAQSWDGLAGADDERYRLAATADGGVWLFRTSRPEPVTELAGTRPSLDTSRAVAGPLSWARHGSSALRPAPVADPEIVRRLGLGQAACLYQGGVTYVQVAPPATGPADPVPPAPPAQQPPPPVRSATGESGPDLPSLPDIGEFLDQAFGGGS